MEAVTPYMLTKPQPTFCLLIITAMLVFVSTSLISPSVSYAQFETGIPGTGIQSDPTATGVPGSTLLPDYKRDTSCESWGQILTNFTSCMGRQLAVWTGELAIYLTGWILGLSAVLFNYALDLTVSGFDSTIYANTRVGIEAVWTTFRDIANILIIGMFTFIALSMILGIEKFNARQAVAHVLVIAVLINFSLLFTRLIITSSNFVAIQFYNAALVGTAPAGVVESATSFGKYQVGISGRFAQLMGVTSFAETDKALWKTATATDSGWTTLLLGIVSAVLFLVTALFFFYASFLLIARAILFIILLITSSLAFASYLIPGANMGGFGWSQWWNALLKNAVFGPLLLIMLWATIQLGEGVAKINSGNGKLGDLLSNASSQGGINALFGYLMILGMLYASIKIATSFSTKIGGFSYAATVPAFGAGILSRVGGFAGRQTIGRGGLALSNNLASRAKKTDNVFAQKLYDFGAQKTASVAKRDFNVMQTSLGGKIQAVAGIKKIESVAGKPVGGFEGAQTQYKQKVAEQAKRLAVSDEEKKETVKKALATEMQNNPALKTKYDQAEREHEAAKTTLENARKDAAIAQGNIESRYKPTLDRMERDLSNAENNLARNPTDPNAINTAQTARAALRSEAKKQQAEMSIQNERIKRATNTVKRAVQQFEDVSEEIGEVAAQANKLPRTFKSAGDIAEKLVTSSYSSLLHATIPTTEGVEKLSKKIGKEAGKPKENKREALDLIRKMAREKLEDEKKKP